MQGNTTALQTLSHNMQVQNFIEQNLLCTL